MPNRETSQPPRTLPAELSEDRKTYYSVLMNAEKLGQTLIHHCIPAATDESYTVTDPRVLNGIVLPIEIRDWIPTSVEFTFDEKFTPAGMIATSAILIGFAEYDMRISIPDDLRSRPQYDITPHKTASAEQLSPDGVSTTYSGTLTRQELSDIIARTVLPTHDPAQADYTRLDIKEVRQTIKETLQEIEFAATDIVYHYEFDNITVTVSSYNGLIYEMGITQPAPVYPGDDYTVALRTEYDHNASSQQIIVHHEGRAVARVATTEEIAGFNVALTNLIDEITPGTDSLDALIEQEQEIALTEAPEERRDGGKAPEY